MFPLLVIAAAQINQPSDIVVGGWDNRPTLTVAEGNRKHLAQLKTAAEQCGFSRTWVWGDSDEVLLWVLLGEASREDGLPQSMANQAPVGSAEVGAASVTLTSASTHFATANRAVSSWLGV